MSLTDILHRFNNLMAWREETTYLEVRDAINDLDTPTPVPSTAVEAGVKDGNGDGVTFPPAQ